MDESNSIQHCSTMQETLGGEYFPRVMVLRTDPVVLLEKGCGQQRVCTACSHLAVLVSFTGGPPTCSSLIDGSRNFSLSTVSTILPQTLTGCTLRAPIAYNTSSRHVRMLDCIVGLDCYLRYNSDPFMQMHGTGV